MENAAAKTASFSKKYTACFSIKRYVEMTLLGCDSAYVRACKVMRRTPHYSVYELVEHTRDS
jgi:hypothetical protein